MQITTAGLELFTDSDCFQGVLIGGACPQQLGVDQALVAARPS